MTFFGPLGVVFAGFGCAVGLLRTEETRRRVLAAYAVGALVSSVLLGVLLPFRTGMFDLLGFGLALWGCAGWPLLVLGLLLGRERTWLGFGLGAYLFAIGWVPTFVGEEVADRCARANGALAREGAGAPDACEGIGRWVRPGPPPAGGFERTRCGDVDVVVFPDLGGAFLQHVRVRDGEPVGRTSFLDGPCAHLDL